MPQCHWCTILDCQPSLQLQSMCMTRHSKCTTCPLDPFICIHRLSSIRCSVWYFVLCTIFLNCKPVYKNHKFVTSFCLIDLSIWFNRVQQVSFDDADRNRFLVTYVDYSFDDFGGNQPPVYPGLSTVWGSLARSKV